MAKSALYTRTGDAGLTSLVGGERVAKASLRLDAYGTVDEFSSFLGVVLSHPACPDDVRPELIVVQSRLFDIGCYLATAVSEGENPAVRGLSQEDLESIEQGIDRMDAATPKVKAFVLPGGTPLSAHAHVARTVCRRAERRIFALAAETYVDPLLTRYINRLSDYLFILARYLNHLAGVEEITWQARR